MARNLVCLKLKNSRWLSFLLLAALLFLIFKPSLVKADLISYPAQLEGCGWAPNTRTTCSASIAAQYNATEASCSSETMTVNQFVTCSASGIIDKCELFRVSRRFPVAAGR